MTTTLERPRPDTQTPASGRSRPKLRGRGWPVAVIGIAAVLLCAVAAWMWAAQSDQSRTVLVAATSMSAGHVLTDADLTEASVTATDLVLIDAAQTDQIVGQTLAVPVTAGTALTPSLIGPAESPQPGRAETTIAFANGFYPSGLESGQAVVLMAGPGGEAAAATADPAVAAGVWQMGAVIRSVEVGDGGALVSLEFNAADRDGLSAARATDLFLVAMTTELAVEDGASAEAEEGE